MVALLDVNVLVALFDEMHEYHEVAHQWFGRNRRLGWATCPLTENGFVRIVSNPTYPGRRTSLRDAIARLEEFRESGHHAFWPDSVSLRDENLFHPEVGTLVWPTGADFDPATLHDWPAREPAMRGLAKRWALAAA